MSFVGTAFAWFTRTLASTLGKLFQHDAVGAHAAGAGSTATLCRGRRALLHAWAIMPTRRANRSIASLIALLGVVWLHMKRALIDALS